MRNEIPVCHFFLFLIILTNKRMQLLRLASKFASFRCLFSEKLFSVPDLVLCPELRLLHKLENVKLLPKRAFSILERGKRNSLFLYMYTFTEDYRRHLGVWWQFGHIKPFTTNFQVSNYQIMQFCIFHWYILAVFSLDICIFVGAYNFTVE